MNFIDKTLLQIERIGKVKRLLGNSYSVENSFKKERYFLNSIEGKRNFYEGGLLKDGCYYITMPGNNFKEVFLLDDLDELNLYFSFIKEHINYSKALIQETKEVLGNDYSVYLKNETFFLIKHEKKDLFKPIYGIEICILNKKTNNEKNFEIINSNDEEIRTAYFN